MNFNTGFFTSHYYRRQHPKITYRVPLTSRPHPHASIFKDIRLSTDNCVNGESFLPSISTSSDGKEGHRPYRRNDFANNHLFIAKHRLTRIFLNQPSTNSQKDSDLAHLFDPCEAKSPKRKTDKQQKHTSSIRLTQRSAQNAHVSVVNLSLESLLISPRTQDSSAELHSDHSDLNQPPVKVHRPSVPWMNPVLPRHMASASTRIKRDMNDRITVINDLLNSKTHCIDYSVNHMDSTLLYVKSILPGAGSQSQ